MRKLNTTNSSLTCRFIIHVLLCLLSTCISTSVHFLITGTYHPLLSPISKHLTIIDNFHLILVLYSVLNHLYLINTRHEASHYFHMSFLRIAATSVKPSGCGHSLLCIFCWIMPLMHWVSIECIIVYRYRKEWNETLLTVNFCLLVLIGGFIQKMMRAIWHRHVSWYF